MSVSEKEVVGEDRENGTYYSNLVREDPFGTYTILDQNMAMGC